MSKDKEKKASGPRTQTVTLKNPQVKKGSVRYEIDNPDKKLAVDNVYVYKNSPVLRGLSDDDMPESITVAVSVTGAAPAAKTKAAAPAEDEDEDEGSDGE
jgi:hypothetical protein